jgi:DNA-directed RNA polymerase III subunit RPC1
MPTFRDDMATSSRDAAAIEFTKTPFVAATTPRKISSVRFSLMSDAEIGRAGVFHVCERNLYQMPQRTPMPNGILDPRMGTTDKRGGECATCRGSMVDCAGHFGYIKLELPVFHIGYFKNIISILQCVCKKCSRVLMNDDDAAVYLKRYRSPKLEINQRRALNKKFADKCKRCRLCPHCGDYNGSVKRAGQTLKIVHEKYSKNPALLEEFMKEFETALKYNESLRASLPRVQDDLNPIRVLGLMQRISDKDCEVLDIAGRPENLLLTHLAVPPCCIRPSVEMDGVSGSNEDDITMKLIQIIEVNNVLRQGLEKGLAINNLMENWDFLQIQCAMYINSELPGLSLQYQGPGKPLRGFVQRLKGKQGRFRGNLSGKRVDFSARTVISPDPNLRIDEVGVPIHIAKTMTYPEVVNKHNIVMLRERVRNGMATHPGANFVKFVGGGMQYLKYGDRRKIASELRFGDIVERHIHDGDILLFNRQPSLHKMSIMAHRARVMPCRTLRFNECVCTPYNADFDGDEMNIHCPQTEEARAEALELMGVHHNLCTPKNGEILIAATQDFLTAAFLLTCKDTFFDRSQFGALVAYMGDALLSVDLPTPAMVKPIELWTGKQIFNVLIRPKVSDQIFVNLEVAEKLYNKKDKEMCPDDGYVCIQNSEVISGRLGKATLGSGNKAGLFYTLNLEYGPQAAANAMNRLAKLSARWLGTRGFSIGIDDVTPAQDLVDEKQRRIDEGYATCDDRIASYQKGTLTLQAGCNAEETLEAEVLGVLSSVREAAGNACLKALPRRNAPLIMALCGSKGSTINISQMVACVGQQAVSGSRPPDGFVERSLPHFRRGEKTPAAKGFVANSFFSGMRPTEFFFHTMAGREGLVDTAVKTAETGYMSRRLMKALEDLSLLYDGTVRNSMQGIVQLRYGDDGMEPTLMEGDDAQPVEFKRCLMNVRGLYPSKKEAPATKSMLDAALTKFRQNTRIVGAEGDDEKDNLVYGVGVAQLFYDQMSAFITKEIEDQAVNGTKITRTQMDAFLNECIEKYKSKRVEPGTAVGAIGAQSIGEPGTQMTLKTFHFAGVASMNITLGVPRIKEIINASKAISTPIITASLVSEKDVTAARVVKGRVEKTTLGEVCSEINVVIRSNDLYLELILDLDAINQLQLDVTVHSARDAILATSKLKLKPTNVLIASENILHVLPQEDVVDEGRALFMLQHLRLAVPNVIVQGIASVGRAVINDKGDGTYNLIVEGTNMQAVMGVDGIKGTETRTNHVMECERTLGIEAARACIIKEINDTMGAHGMSIDNRHSMLLADVMTYKGEVLGITRFGMAKMKDSVLMLASFEKTTDHLFDAALHGRTDTIDGVSECIIMGIPMPIGTGMFPLQHRAMKLDVDINVDEEDGREQVITRVTPEKMEELPKRPPLLLQGGFCRPIEAA